MANFDFLGGCRHGVLERTFLPNGMEGYRCAACKDDIAGVAELMDWQNHVADLNHFRRAVEEVKEHRQRWKVTRWILPEGWTESSAAAYRMAMDYVCEILDPLGFDLTDEEPSPPDLPELPGETSP